MTTNEQRPSISIYDAASIKKKLQQEHAFSSAAWSFEDWLTIRYEDLRRKCTPLAGATPTLLQSELRAALEMRPNWTNDYAATMFGRLLRDCDKEIEHLQQRIECVRELLEPMHECDPDIREWLGMPRYDPGASEMPADEPTGSLREAFERFCKIHCSAGAMTSDFYWLLFQSGAEAARMSPLSQGSQPFVAEIEPHGWAVFDKHGSLKTHVETEAPGHLRKWATKEGDEILAVRVVPIASKNCRGVPSIPADEPLAPNLGRNAWPNTPDAEWLRNLAMGLFSDHHRQHDTYNRLLQIAERLDGNTR